MLRSLPRTVALALALGGLAAASTLAGCRDVVVLRGDAGGDDPLPLVATCDNLAEARYLGTDGGKVLETYGQELRRQGALYRRAQRSAGVAEDDLQPLYVVLDPEGSWAHARPHSKLSYRDPEGKVVEVEAPYLMLGENRGYYDEGAAATPEDGPRNVAILKSLNQWYHQAVTGQPRPPSDYRQSRFWKDVYQFGGMRIDGRDDLGRLPYREAAPHARSVDYVKQLGWGVTRNLQEHLEATQGLDPEAAEAEAKRRWETFAERPYVKEAVEASKVPAMTHSVSTTLVHEIGHLIHFAAVGDGGFDIGPLRAHMQGNSHSLETLSSPEFALVEGWAIAHTSVLLDEPDLGGQQAATTVEHSETIEYVRKRWNVELFQGISEAQGEDPPLEAPDYALSPRDFEAALRARAAAAGMDAAAFDAARGSWLEEASFHQQLERLLPYMDRLEARQGGRRERYDFLRSERSVAYTLTQLRGRFGPESTERLLETMARHRPADLAGLLEAYVRDHPDDKVELYQALAEVTDGILVTPAQAALVRRRELARQSAPALSALEIDLDRDGSLPPEAEGIRDAASVAPDAFPEEPPPLPDNEDPLYWDLLGDLERRRAKAAADSEAEAQSQEPPAYLGIRGAPPG